MDHNEPSGSTPRKIPRLQPPREVGTALLTYACTICNMPFAKIEESIKHELIAHAVSVPRKKPIEMQLNTLGLERRNAFDEEMRNCADDEVVMVLLKFYSLDSTSVNNSYRLIRSSLWDALQKIHVKSINSFGSMAYHLPMQDSDFDIYIEHNDIVSFKSSVPERVFKRVFNTIIHQIHMSKSFDSVIPIRSARVPLIKCKHILTGFHLDINISCPGSLVNSSFLRNLVDSNDCIYGLMLFLKVWAIERTVLKTCQMSSYCFLTLIVFYLQQPQLYLGGDELLPSIGYLQSKCKKPNYVRGVNYAYARFNITALPSSITIATLVRGFFEFYSQYNFNQNIVAPHIGRSVSLHAFKTGTYVYDAYDTQLHDLQQYWPGEQPLQVDRVMCVQDMFCLNYNLAKQVAKRQLIFLDSCLQQAKRICADPKLTSDADLLMELLHGVPKGAAKPIATLSSILSPVASSFCIPMSQSLCYSIHQSRVERKALKHIAPFGIDLNNLWAELYLKAIIETFTEIFRFTMEPMELPTKNSHNNNNSGRVNDIDKQTVHVWKISATVDMWTGRLNNRFTPFKQLQNMQTKKFIAERWNNPDYVVCLNSVLTIKVLTDSAAIEVIVLKADLNNTIITKKDPLSKFFAIFKNTIQHFNLKEKINELN